MDNVCVLGSGSWATAIVKILLEHKDTHVNWWVREPEIRQSLLNYGINYRYLSEAELDMENVTVIEDINEAVASSDLVFMVIPSAFAAKSLSELRPELFLGRNWVSATKGLIAPGDLTVTQFLATQHHVPQECLSVVSGPTHAEEVARKRLSYLTVASKNSQLVEYVRSLMGCRFVVTIDSEDVEGIEYATAMKNVYALGLGIAYGMGLGDNMQAVLVTSAIKEMMLFLEHHVPMESRRGTDSVYLGDLLVTCYSHHSRNRMFGTMIGQGYSVKAAQLEMNMVAEGYYAVESLERLREKSGLKMPLVQAVYEILYKAVPPQVMMRKVGEILLR
ncbi:MAG: glycerol-3-phosphate dehydrogenase [Bacteroidales bacterium]|nr:glycerol-3-phosphate dehydrogenase [Bacteroidales bacterium]